MGNGLPNHRVRCAAGDLYSPCNTLYQLLRINAGADPLDNPTGNDPGSRDNKSAPARYAGTYHTGARRVEELGELLFDSTSHNHLLPETIIPPTNDHNKGGTTTWQKRS